MGGPSERDVAAAVGGSVRLARLRLGLSMRDLAAAADLSQPFLSNIENGRSMPSVATLYKLAGALGLPPSDLLPDGNDSGVTVIRAGDGVPTPVDDAPGDATAWLLTGGRGRLLEVFRYGIGAGQPVGGFFEHEGEDFLHVTAGLLTVEFASGRTERIGAGDSLWHQGSLRHRWRVGDREGADLLLVTARAPGAHTR